MAAASVLLLFFFLGVLNNVKVSRDELQPQKKEIKFQAKSKIILAINAKTTQQRRRRDAPCNYVVQAGGGNTPTPPTLSRRVYIYTYICDGDAKQEAGIDVY